MAGRIRIAAVLIGVGMVAAGLSGVVGARTADAATSDWHVQTTPNATTHRGVLRAVSCPELDRCVAAGDRMSADGYPMGYSVSWNGSNRKVVYTPRPAGVGSVSLQDVSCSSPTFCVAVGTLRTSGGERRPTSLIWNGSGWRVAAMPEPAGTQDTTALATSAVSCAGGTRCVAVGYYVGSSASPSVPFVEAWDGSGWSIETPALPAGSSLSDVSCATATFCVVVGGANNGQDPLAQMRNGSTWSAVTLPAAPGGLNSISCASATACTAVGTTADGTTAAGG